MVFYGRGEPVVALDKVDMQVPAGQFASIIGPSGCGKSTLLLLVADVMQPHAGRIRLGGETPRAARHAHSLGFVFQSPTLLPWRSVKQNIELPLDIVGRRSTKRSARTTSDLIELGGLTGFENPLPLPRPRGLEMMRTQMFFDCVNRVRDGLFGNEQSAAPRPEPVEAY